MSAPEVASARETAGPHTGARAGAAVLAMALGAIILYAAGFAHPHALHEAAHDSRHAFVFPCH